MELIREEIMQQLLQGMKTDKPSKLKDLKKYIGTAYDFIGLSVPQQRAIFKQGFSFDKLTDTQQLEIWDNIWKTSEHYEMMNFAQMFASKHTKRLSAFESVLVWNTVKDWVKQIDNWAHSDGLSSIYAHLLEKEPDILYSQYILWNTSLNPWERRQSVVGILYYSTIRKDLLSFEKIREMIITLLHDENYFVQKGVGWTLREMGNVYPAETLAFLNEQITSIQPVAFTAAIEKLDVVAKDRLKQLRKVNKKAVKTD